MPEEITIGRTLRIRECGFDEYWLQDQIYKNPNGLGELESLSKEKSQSSGGRLDLLLIDPEDDSMYEVEVMLGDTDEKHIIRTIEYWDNEKRRWPQRQHFAVLVSESITRRFFNVIQLLGYGVPIIWAWKKPASKFTLRACRKELAGRVALTRWSSEFLPTRERNCGPWKRLPRAGKSPASCWRSRP